MKILFQGDSITDGNRYKDEESRWDKNHQIGHSYAFIVTGLLGLKYPERNYEFINRGISGNRVRDLYNRWEEDALKINPDILSILIGTNDATWPYEDERDDLDCVKYEETYRKILTMSKEKNPNLKIIMLESFEYIESQSKDIATPKEIRIKRATRIRKIIKKLADEFNAIFIPLNDKFLDAMSKGNPRYWLWDGVHPTEAGHALIAMEFLEKTKELF